MTSFMNRHKHYNYYYFFILRPTVDYILNLKLMMENMSNCYFLYYFNCEK